MSFFLMKLKQKSRQSRTRSQIWQSRCLPPRLHRLLLNPPTAPVLPERMPEFVQEELKTLQETIRQDARSGNTRPSAASIFSMEPASGTRVTTVRERPCLQTFIRFCLATGCR